MFQIKTMVIMSFWSFLNRPGDKHDAEKISISSSTPKQSWSKLTILPWVSRCFNFSHDKTPNLIVFSEISFWNDVSLFNKNGNVYCCWIVSDSPHLNAENRKLQETSRRFCEALVGHKFFKGDEIIIIINTFLYGAFTKLNGPYNDLQTENNITMPI